MMFCTNCGAPRNDDATVCTNCNQAVPRFPPPPTVPNYLIQAVLLGLCCCLPLGVVAIIYAAQVNSKLSAGDIAGAEKASRNARMWCWIGLGAGILVWVSYGIFIAVNVAKS